jgi:HAD superfamily hydrolase (TIGR01509 family)
MKPKAIIFDLDGVLLNTEPLYFEATSKLLANYSKKYSIEDQVRIMGKRPNEAALSLINLYQLPMNLKEYFEVFSIIFNKLLERIQLMHGAESFVSHLKNLKLPLAIASSSDAPSYKEKTQKFKTFFEQFESIVLGDDPDCLHGKPDPSIFLLAAARLGVKPEDCLVLEDAPNGILAARRAGMQVFAIADPRFDKKLYHQAHACFDSLEALHEDNRFIFMHN